ncbi:MAG TPA: VWA domain-containing protein [Pyrinomonadaceae bacterium]|jgi:VWFA-related protein|nr:VWA domain-containing protein [Pyrinomonadaceae bacterium]
MKIFFTRRAAAAFALALCSLAASAAHAPAQSRRTPPQEPQKRNTRPDETKPAQQQTEPAAEPVPPDAIKSDEVVKVSSNIVQIEAVVINKKTKQIMTGLKQQNFQIFEDGVQKEITNFSTPDSPITVAVVLEFSKIGQFQAFYGSSGTDRYGMEEMLAPTFMFLRNVLQTREDYVSVIAYDMRPTPLTDFTNDPSALNKVMNILATNRPVSDEAVLYKALTFVLAGGRADSVVVEGSDKRWQEYGGMRDITGRRKAIFLVTTGLDTSMDTNLDKVRKVIQNAGIPIYIIGTGELFFKKFGDDLDPMDNIAGAGRFGRMSMLQARNSLRVFAEESGGMYFPITFAGELGSALQSINALMRNQYSLAYSTGERRDGKRHKIVVKVDIDGDGKPEEKEFVVQARQYYNSPKEGEAKK